MAPRVQGTTGRLANTGNASAVRGRRPVNSTSDARLSTGASEYVPEKAPKSRKKK